MARRARGIESGTGGNQSPAVNGDDSAGSGTESAGSATFTDAAAAIGESASASADASTTEPTRRRGRPRGSTAKAGAPEDIGAIAQTVVSVHAFAAWVTATPALEVTTDEAQRLADATVKLGNEYGVRLSGKPLAWTQFIAAVGEVYGKRISAVMLGIDATQAPKPPATPIPANEYGGALQ